MSAGGGDFGAPTHVHSPTSAAGAAGRQANGSVSRQQQNGNGHAANGASRGSNSSGGSSDSASSPGHKTSVSATPADVELSRVQGAGGEGGNGHGSASKRRAASTLINVGARDMSTNKGIVGTGPGPVESVRGNPAEIALNAVPGKSSVKNAAAAATGAAHAKQEDRVINLEKGMPHFPSNEKGRQPVYASSTNCVITSKYTLITFLPRNLFEQFSNLANLYFLLVGIFQIIPQFSTTDGNPTMYQPLAFIVFVSACRAAKEDWDKHKADAQRNGFKYGVYKNGEVVETESGDIRVGDVVKVLQNNMIPADMLFLGSALAKGHCFIDKSNLNGETTLEVLNSMVQTRPFAKDERSLAGLSLSLQYEPPNKRFDSFRGQCHMRCGNGEEYSVDGKSLMMRETNLRNCDYVWGLVVYTGNDTKIQRSNLEGEKPKTKVSFIMRQVNTYLMYMLILQSVLCLVGGILAGVFRDGFTSEMWFLGLEGPGSAAPDAPRSGVYAFFSWFILLSQMVPISLIVSGELVKFVQSLFIEQDIQLYYPKLNKTAKCNSSTIHEDLGLIDYIFSDKTGTLTQNKMEFRYLLLPHAGEFGSRETDIAKSVKIRQKQLEDKQAGRPVSANALTWSQLVKPHLAPRDPKIDTDYCCTKGWFSDNCWSSPKDTEHEKEDDAPLAKNEFTEDERQALFQRLYGKPPSGESAEETQKARASLRRYMVHMALSNTVKPYDDEGVIKFQAESAEELAMATWSRSCGFFKRQINPTILEITEYDENLREKPNKVIETYNHVGTFGFTSKRARVTVIYQRVDGPEQKCHVMMKGQDTVALPLVNLGDQNEDELLEDLKNMSTNGLRTLVCGFAELPSSWWAERAAQYQQIIQRDTTPASEGHPEKCVKGKCEKCEQHEFFERTEKDAGLLYLGALGLEDQLQLLVPECIADVVAGGVKVWMITGDKLETAKNIGLATNLIDPDMIPSFSSADVDTVVQEFQRTRLIEVTGSWANLAQSEEALSRIFDTFDKDQKGQLDIDELHYIITALRCNLDQDKLRAIIAENSPKAVAGANGAPPTSIDRAGFMHLLRSTQMSKFDAVWFDVEEGIKTYNSIQNHDQFPVSLLIDRAAFQVLFPGKAGGTPTAADLAALGPGVTLKKLRALREMFFQIAGRSKSVVFARAEPAMKKRMVTEIQARVQGAITLAIGDGANDTDMITAAHVGVGIAGVEGTAATNSADYAIGTFRMLHSLLFVHGFYSYQRTSKMVNFIFYKASLVAVMMFLFGFFSAMSGQQFFQDAPYQLYNVVFTALPILVVAVFDKPLSASFLQDNPRLYQLQKHTAFDPMIFSGWILRAFMHACIIYFIPYAAFGVDNVSQSDGSADGLWFFSMTVYYCTVMTPTLLIMYDMSNITFLHWMSILCSVAALFIITLIMNFMTSLVPDLNGLITLMYATAMFWLVLIVTVGACMILELIWRAWMRELYPTVVQIYQEIMRMPPEQQKRMLDPAKLTPPQPAEGAHAAHGQAPQSGFGAASAASGGPAASDDHIQVEYSQSHAFSGDPTAHSARGMSQRTLDTPGRQGRGSFSGMRGESARGRDKLKNNMVRAMLRFRNMTGAQFDSAAQAQLQQHDKFRHTDADGKEVASPEPLGGAASSGYAQRGYVDGHLRVAPLQSPANAAPSPSGVNFVHGAPSPAVHNGGAGSHAEALLNRYEHASSSASSSQQRNSQQVIDLTEELHEPKTDDRRIA